MNKILYLFNKEFVKNLFDKKVLPKYKNYKKISSIKIKSYKHGVWDETYHVVIEFYVVFIDENNNKIKFPIFCSAHSNEPRKNVYRALKFLWENNFNKGYLIVPKPLFYSNYFKATFYEGVVGDTLFSYIKNDDKENIRLIVKKSAQWFAKLHNLKIKNIKNFNLSNSRIETVFPGVKNVLKRIKSEYPEYIDDYKKIYALIIKNENNFLRRSRKRYLIHGDAHPDNVIKIGKEKTAVIDFADFCLGDFTRDLGTFLQQFRYMSSKIEDKNFISEMERLFLDNYFKNSKKKLNDEIKKRINNYYNYTSIRTATYFLMKEKPNKTRAESLIKNVCKNLGI